MTRCNHPLGSSGAVSVRCVLPLGHGGEHASLFGNADHHLREHMRQSAAEAARWPATRPSDPEGCVE